MPHVSEETLRREFFGRVTSDAVTSVKKAITPNPNLTSLLHPSTCEFSETKLNYPNGLIACLRLTATQVQISPASWRKIEI